MPSKLWERLKVIGSNIGDFGRKIWDGVKVVGSKVLDVAKPISSGLSSVIGFIDKTPALNRLINSNPLSSTIMNGIRTGSSIMNDVVGGGERIRGGENVFKVGRDMSQRLPPKLKPYAEGALNVGEGLAEGDEAKLSKGVNKLVRQVRRR